MTEASRAKTAWPSKPVSGRMSLASTSMGPSAGGCSASLSFQTAVSSASLGMFQTWPGSSRSEPSKAEK